MPEGLSLEMPKARRSRSPGLNPEAVPRPLSQLLVAKARRQVGWKTREKNVYLRIHESEQ